MNIKNLPPDIDEYCQALGLAFDDLVGKRILDIGCGYPRFVAACHELGINDAYGIDCDIAFLRECTLYRRNIIAGLAQKLPFRDTSFDLVIAHSSVSFLLDTADDVLSLPRDFSWAFILHRLDV